MRAAITLAIAVTLYPSSGTADPIAISGIGTLYYACCGAAAGDPFTFGFTFDAVSADRNADPKTGEFSLGTGTLSLRLGQFDFTTASHVRASVSNERHGDSLSIWVDSFDPPPSSDTRLAVSLSAASSDGAYLRDDQWPVDIVNTFNAAPFRSFMLWRLDGDFDRPLVDHHEVRLSYGSPPAPVPEPATMVLVGFGVAAVGARRWRQRRKEE